MHSRRLYACVVAAVLAVASVAVLIARDSLNIRLRDDCDPASFNAAVGPGTCVGEGDTTFDDFLDEFQQTGQVEKWRFNNDHADVDRGTAITINNRGGETHTFTQVSQFGFGIVPILNTLTFGATGPPLPEFATATFLAPGQTQVIRTTGKPQQRLTLGTHLFECAIHPWMRATVVVLNDED